MSYSFPYNQTVCAYTTQTGAYAGYTFIISACSNGLGVGEVQPTTPAGASVNSYNVNIPYNISAEGSSNTALTFLPNPSGTAPYYFLVGSAGKNLWLYSINPAADASSFAASNISSPTEVGSFDTAVSAILYCASLNTVYVAGANGNLYTYSVAWNGAVPSLSYVGENNSFTNASSGIVSLALDDNNNVYVTGLTINDQIGTFVFAATTGVLEASGLIPNTSNSVATAITPQGIYTATASGLVYNSFAGGIATPGVTVWVPSGESIISLAWSPNPSNLAPNGAFIDGCLFIGTYDTANGESNTNPGSLYTYDPSTATTSNPLGIPPQVFADNNTQGAPYSMCADNNLNLLLNCGSTGLYFYSIVYNQNSGVPQYAQLIPNEISKSTSFLVKLGTLAVLAFYLIPKIQATNQPAPAAPSTVTQVATVQTVATVSTEVQTAETTTTAAAETEVAATAVAVIVLT